MCRFLFCFAKMKILIARSKEERDGLREQIESEKEVEQEQLENMRAAGLKQAQREREAFIEEKHALDERFIEMQKENEENMKMIQSMSEMIARHKDEKLQLRAQTEEFLEEEAEEALRELNDRHSEEVNAFLKKMDIHLDDIKSSGEQDLYSTEKDEECAKKLEELPQMMTSRAQMVGDLQQRMAENEREQESVKKGEFLKKYFLFVSSVAPAIGEVVALYPPAAPYAKPVSSAVSQGAKALSDNCSVM